MTLFAWMGGVRLRLPIAALALSLASWGVVAPPAHAADGWSSAPVISSAASRQNCADFLFVGVRGSGEPDGFGATITGVRDGLKKQWKRDGTVRQVWLDYPAVAPQTLEKVPMESLLFDQPMPSTGYFDSAISGGEKLTTIIRDAQERCPRERVVLAGFSQGAQVITRALAETRPGDRLLAAILLGNPSHYPGQNVRELDGSADDTAIGMGAFLTVTRVTAAAKSTRQDAVEAVLQQTFDVTEGKADRTRLREAMTRSGDQIPPEAYPITYSVCLAGDMVCDSAEPMSNILVAATTMQDEMNRTRPIHLNYKSGNIKHTLDAVGAAINAAKPIEDPKPAAGPARVRIERLPGRPNWKLTAEVGLGAAVTGFIAGLLVGRANRRVGRRSRRPEES